VRAYPGVLVPDGGWAGPTMDGELIGYRYVIRFHEFNPPLVYPRPETFIVLGVMSFLSSGTSEQNAVILDIEKRFVAMAEQRGLNLYLQAENIGCRIDWHRYYGEQTYRHFQTLKHQFDPHSLFNNGVVFPAP
jgi:hypothetical protein